MSNRRTSRLDQLRTMVWARSVAVAAGVRKPDQLELLLAEKLSSQQDEPTGRFRDYCSGKTKPFFRWQPRVDSKWVDHCESLFPGTSSWFHSPIWYLLEEHEFLASEILACATQLQNGPINLLVLDAGPGSSSGFQLAELYPERIWELARLGNLWALGAVSCALRRAELAGQPAVFRRAGVAILWLLDRLIPTEDEWVQEPLIELRTLFAAKLQATQYPAAEPMLCPIGQADFDHLEAGMRWIDTEDYWRALSKQLDLETSLAKSFERSRKRFHMAGGKRPADTPESTGTDT
jgi:hypothetical protein